MKLSTWLIRRLIQAIGVLLGLSILVFLITRVMPGNPARVALGARAPQEVVEELERRMHLNDPLYLQYYYWLSGVFHGDFGESLFTRRPVLDDIKEYLPATMELALMALIFQAVLGVTLGGLAAGHENRWVDHSVRLGAYLGIVTPSFVFAIVFVLLFGYALRLFPTMGRLSAGVVAPRVITGMTVIDGLITGHFAAVGNALWHLILPALSLAMAGIAQESRITRASIVDNLRKDYVGLSRTFFIPERKILFKYLLKPSLIPTVSIMGLDFACMLGHGFLVELIFNWPGLSRYGMNTMLRKDLNAVTAVILVLGVVFVTVNIIVDLVVAYLDPRIRMGTERGT